MAEGTVICAVRAHRLPTSHALPPPEPVATVGRDWPEHQRRHAVELVADGVSGWYGPVSDAVLTLVRDLYAAGLVGHDATQHRKLPYRPRTGRHLTGAHARIAYSAVELACWDLAGRASERPVTELLGGVVRDVVPVYASALGCDPTHPSAPETAKLLHDTGFWGQKWPLPQRLLAEGTNAVAACLVALRTAAPQARVMVDGLGGGRLDQVVALLPVLAELQVTWAEELLPTNGPGWSRLAQARGGVPFAAGEHAYDPADAARLLAEGGLDVWQVDVGWCGGLAQALHSVDMATAFGLPTFPHGDSMGAALALAATCCRDKVPALEYHVTLEPVRQSVSVAPLVVDAGRLTLPRTPGLHSGYHLDTRTPPVTLAGGRT